MAVSDSDDASDIFWPGYVDAISNLAINLLFVIAIMAIVVISSTLEMQQMLKKKDIVLGADGGLFTNPTAVNAENNPIRQTSPDTLISARQQGSSMQPTSHAAATKEEAQQKEIKALQEKLQTTQAQLQKSTAALAQLQSTSKEASKSASKSQASNSDSTTDSGRQELVEANTPAPVSQGKNRSTAMQSGVVVRFSPNVVQLSDIEAQDFVTKAKTFAALNSNTKWRILVVSQKGFSESSRLAFYRANAVRSAMIKEGVPGSNITLRILESDQSNADNSRVIVKPE